MKKLLPILCIFATIGLLIQITVQYFIKEHKEKYSIITKDNSYMIEENYKLNDDHIYEFYIKDKYKNNYTFEIKNNFNKKSNVIKDIKFFNYKDIKCIYPIYKNKYVGNLTCNYKKEAVTVDYLMQIKNKNISKVINKLKQDKYYYSSWKKSNEIKKHQKIEVYQKNIPNDTYFTMWNYKGFERLSNKKIETKVLYDTDVYENNITYYSGQYMISMYVDSVKDIEYYSFYIYDVLNGGKTQVEMDFRISKDMYFNGTYKGNIYITDIKNKKQYKINPKADEIKEIGNEKIGYKTVKNDKMIDMNSKHFFKTKQLFDEVDISDELEKEFKDIVDIKENFDKYYIMDKNYSVYRVYKDNIKKKLKLFQFENIKDWQVKNDSIIVLNGEILYYYDDEVGLVPIIKNKEFLYNYKNICNFVKK